MTPSSTAPTHRDGVTPSDRQIASRIRPLLAACALGLVPFTVYSTFLVEIGRDGDHDTVLLGLLRGVGGGAALAGGLCCAPLLDRVSRRMVAAGALAVLALACLLGVLGSVWSWAVFCLLVGATTAVLTPALAAMAADCFENEAASGRAATQVTAVTTLTATLAAPVLAGPAVLWGWQGDLVATAVLAVATGSWILGQTGREMDAPPVASAPVGYVTGLRGAWALPGVPAVISVSALRTTAFMGQLAYLAAVYSERFALGPGVFSLVWTLSGLSFFVSNWCSGRALRSLVSASRAAWAACGAAVLGAAGVLVLFRTEHCAAALLATVLLAASHAVVAAVVTTVLVRGSKGHRGAVLGLNGAAQSLGVCLGATAAGAALQLGGWDGVGMGLAVVTLLAAAAAGYAALTLRTAPWQLGGWREGSGR